MSHNNAIPGSPILLCIMHAEARAHTAHTRASHNAMVATFDDIVARKNAQSAHRLASRQSTLGSFNRMCGAWSGARRHHAAEHLCTWIWLWMNPLLCHREATTATNRCGICVAVVVALLTFPLYMHAIACTRAPHIQTEAHCICR